MPLFGQWMWKKNAGIYLVLWPRTGVVEEKRLVLHLGCSTSRSILADVLGSPVAIVNMPPIFFILYMLAASLKSSCPKWHGFCPSPDGSISQDSEKANWNILFSLIYSSQPTFQSWVGVWRAADLPSPKASGLLLFDGLLEGWRRLPMCFIYWIMRTLEANGEVSVPFVKLFRMNSMCRSWDRRTHALFSCHSTPTVSAALLICFPASGGYLDALTWMIHGISSTLLPSQLAY